MKNKFLLSLLTTLGFSGCSNIGDEPLYYGPGPNWDDNDITLTSQVINEDKEGINGIRVVTKYKNQNDSLITDTAYTKPHDINGISTDGITTNTLNFEKYPPKDGKATIEYTDMDGEENGDYQQKVIETEYSELFKKIVLDKKAAEGEDKADKE